MSVPAWERDKSKTDFIRLLMELNIRMGKILMRLSRKNVTRHRRKLKRLAKKNVDLDSARQTHQSWRGYAEKYDTRDTVETMDDLFRDLFGGE